MKIQMISCIKLSKSKFAHFVSYVELPWKADA